MNESTQRAFSSLRTKRAEVGIVFVVMKHATPIFFGDPSIAAMKVLGG